MLRMTVDQKQKVSLYVGTQFFPLRTSWNGRKPVLMPILCVGLQRLSHRIIRCNDRYLFIYKLRVNRRTCIPFRRWHQSLLRISLKQLQRFANLFLKVHLTGRSEIRTSLLMNHQHRDNFRRSQVAGRINVFRKSLLQFPQSILILFPGPVIRRILHSRQIKQVFIVNNAKRLDAHRNPIKLSAIFSLVKITLRDIRNVQNPFLYKTFQRNNLSPFHQNPQIFRIKLKQIRTVRRSKLHIDFISVAVILLILRIHLDFRIFLFKNINGIHRPLVAV